MNMKMKLLFTNCKGLNDKVKNTWSMCFKKH